MKISNILVAARFTAAAGILLALSPAMATPVWNAAADFSTTASTGVNGVWSYGSTGTALNGSFAAFGTHSGVSGYDAWSWSDPTVHIGKAGAADFPSSGSIIVPANTLNVSPGRNGEYAVLRFTAQAAGSYEVNAGFWGNDYRGPTTTDAHVRANGVDLFSGQIASYGQANGSHWSGVLTLLAGQSVDFAVGFGANQTWTCDNTGISATVAQVSAVPEPGNLAMLASGLGLLAFAVRRKA